MLNPNLLRKNPYETADHLKKRGFDINLKYLGQLEEKRKAVQSEVENLRSQRNTLAKKVGQLKFLERHGECECLMSDSRTLLGRLKQLEDELTALQRALESYLATVPNLPHFSVPLGKSSCNNIEVRRWSPNTGCPNNSPSYLAPTSKPRDHVSLGIPLGLDFDIAAKLAGSRFSIMRGPIARLHRALSQFMLDVQINNYNYTECYTPYIVKGSTLYGTGQLPKFKEDMFSVLKGNEESLTDSSENFYNQNFLVSTSEVTLTSIVRDSIIPHIDLPIKLTAHTPCFRSEAGSGGRDLRGIIRQHQFDKVEIVQITRPENSYETLEQMVNHAEHTLKLLQLPYRVVLLCAGDLGFTSTKTYDLEVWLPAQNTWCEISSVSNCGDFQARRMQARFRESSGKTALVHTLNGSCLAVGRTLVALLENGQRDDGSVNIPVPLQPYMGGLQILQSQI